MKFLLLSYGTPAGRPDGLVAELIDSGEYVYAAGLVTDSPSAEAVLSSFSIVEVPGRDRAVEIAGRLSGVLGRTEVRLVDSESDGLADL